jgi:hypothetical protein
MIPVHEVQECTARIYGFSLLARALLVGGTSHRRPPCLIYAYSANDPLQFPTATFYRVASAVLALRGANPPSAVEIAAEFPSGATDSLVSENARTLEVYAILIGRRTGHVSRAKPAHFPSVETVLRAGPPIRFIERSEG